MKALVVDDSRVMRRILKGILQPLGFEVEEADDGEKALETIRSGGGVDVVLADWNMPVMSGLELVHALKSDPIHSNVPILMVTSESSLDQIDEAFCAGINEYIMKPFDAEAIKTKLQMIGVLA